MTPRKPLTFAHAATCLALLSLPTLAMVELFRRIEKHTGRTGGREP